MAHPFFALVSKLARKLVMAVLIAALAVVTWSLWLYGKDRVSYDERRAEIFAELNRETETVTGELGELKARRETVSVALTAQEQRIALAEKTLKTLHELDPGLLERAFGESEQQARNAAQIKRVETLKGEAESRATELRRELTETEAAIPLREQRLASIEEDTASLRNQEHEATHYLRVAWREARWVAVVAFLVYLFGGLVIAMLLYYAWAGGIVRGRPIELGTESPALPRIGESSMAVEDALWPGESVWARKGFLQSHDDGLTRKKRFIFNWRQPVSNLVAGLCKMIELRNSRSDGERRVVFASGKEPFAELAVVAVPEGGSFVVRPRFVVGYISRADERPRIRRRWRFFKWQAWVAGQWGYFEFFGPCRIVVSCVSALKTERLNNDDTRAPGHRTSQAGVVGFTPRLQLKPVRSSGFWRYCRGRSPLFEVELIGAGVALIRQNDVRGRDGARARLLRWFGI